MRQIFLIGLLGFAGAVVGCGSSVETTSAATGAGGGAASTTGQGGGASACPAVAAFQVEIHRNNEALYEDCSLPAAWTAPDLVTRGVVTKSTGSSFEVDACANIECKMPEAYQVSLANLGASSGVPFLIPIGTFVELRYARFDTSHQCAYTLVVTNLPVLNGAANPTESGSALWFQGQEGATSKGSPVVAGFSTSHPCGQVHGDTYPYGWDLQVSAADDPAKQQIEVPTGAVITWSPGTPALPGTYAVKSLGSVWTSIETLENNFVVTRAPVK